MACMCWRVSSVLTAFFLPSAPSAPAAAAAQRVRGCRARAWSRGGTRAPGSVLRRLRVGAELVPALVPECVDARHPSALTGT